MQGNSKSHRGSFLTRDTSCLDKLAAMTKSKAGESRSGTGAKNTKNFVFATISPDKKSVEEDKEETTTKVRKSNRKRLAAEMEANKKKAKIDRTLDENSMDTIFGFMWEMFRGNECALFNSQMVFIIT